MHKREPLIWKDLCKDQEESYQNGSLEEGCIRLIETLRSEGDENLKAQIEIAEKEARRFKY